MTNVNRSSRLVGLLPVGHAIVMLAVAVWLRCDSLGNIPGINGDEAWYGAQAIEWLRGEPVRWQTPPGNPLNPFFFLPVALVHLGLGPSAVALRAAALISGLAALAVNWLLCRRVFDRRTAVVSTLVLAVLPIDIAYSRFAWDASQSVLACLPVVYCSLGALRFPERYDRLLAWAIIAQVVAVWVHPTNIFAGGAIAVAVAWRTRRTLSQPGARVSRHRIARAAAIAGLAGLALAIWTGRIAGNPGTSRIAGIDDLRETLSPAGLSQCAVLYAQLYSGEAIYQYVAGSQSWLHWPHDAVRGGWSADAAVCWLLLAGSLILLSARERLGASVNHGRLPVSDQPSPRAPRNVVPLPKSEGSHGPASDRPLVAAWLLQLAAFVALAGHLGMVPGQERYAMCLIPMGVLILARGLVAMSRRRPRLWTAAAVAACLLGWFLLADFHEHYVRFVQRTGGDAHRTLRTAAVEPKQAAIEYIVAGRASGPGWIVASEWWNYQPLRYLAMCEADLHVVTPKQAAEVEEFASALASGRVWYVEFDGSDGLAGARAAQPGHATEEHTIRDYAGRPVLVVLRFAK